MSDVYIVGTHATPVGRFQDKSFTDLLREAYIGALGDAAIADGNDIGHVWFSNYMMDYWGQPYIRGQACMRPLVRDGLLPPEVATTNVEGACASGSVAFNGAWKEILSGQSSLCLAIGVEKLYDPDHPNEALATLSKGSDKLHPEDSLRLYSTIAAEVGKVFEPKRGQSIAMDVYALWAARREPFQVRSILTLSHDVQPPRLLGGVCPIADIELRIDILQMILDGFHRNVERRRDPFV
jgi:Thiolase, N-terminal domain